jgi:hypothetical protein
MGREGRREEGGKDGAREGDREREIYIDFSAMQDRD